MDIFFWGYVKNIVYQVKTAELRTLQHHIAKVIATVTEIKLMNTWREIKYRFDLRHDRMMLTLKPTK
jgi:hypothetical protein